MASGCGVVRYVTRPRKRAVGREKDSYCRDLLRAWAAQRSIVRLGQILDGGPIGDDDQAVGDSHAALALPGAQILVHAFARCADHVAELALGEVNALDR